MAYKNICLLPLLFSRHFNYCSRTLPLPLFIFSLTTFSSFLHFVLPIYLFPCLPPSISFCLPPLTLPCCPFHFSFLFVLSYFFFPFSHFTLVRGSPSISLFDYIHFHLFLCSSAPFSLSFNSSFQSYYLLPPFV